MDRAAKEVDENELLIGSPDGPEGRLKVGLPLVQGS